MNIYLPLHTWVFLPAASVYGASKLLLHRWLDRMWPISGYHQGWVVHTTSVYGPWALVVKAKVLERRILLSSSFSLFSYIYISLSFFSIIFNRIFYSLFCSKVELHYFFGWPLVWMELVVRLSPSSPTLGLLCKSQVCRVKASSWVCSITKGHRCVWLM